MSVPSPESRAKRRFLAQARAEAGEMLQQARAELHEQTARLHRNHSLMDAASDIIRVRRLDVAAESLYLLLLTVQAYTS